LSAPQNQNFNYITPSNTWHQTSCIYVHFWQWASLRITLRITLRWWRHAAPLSNLQQVPDTCHDKQKDHDFSGSFWAITGARVPTRGMHYGVLTDAPHPLTLFYSNESDIAFSTCQRITHLSFPGRARYHSQLCVFSWTDLVMLSSRCSLVISTFVFDILQIPSACWHTCRGCIALTCKTPSPGSRPVCTSLRRNLKIFRLFKSCHRINNKRFSLPLLPFSFRHYSTRRTLVSSQIVLHSSRSRDLRLQFLTSIYFRSSSHSQILTHAASSLFQFGF
jgi:hypothetical protein